jgi:hypothetical protein
VCVCHVCDVSERVREEMHEFLVHDLHFCFIFVVHYLHVFLPEKRCTFPVHMLVKQAIKEK